MKRKVVLYISQSLDDFIADQHGNVDWILGHDEAYVSDYGYEAFTKTVDTIIMGARTYHQIKDVLSPNTWVYEDLQSYVLTHEKKSDTSNIKYVNLSIKTLIDQLMQEDGKDIWICGGSCVIDECIQENLIDEYQITTVPVILGGGIRLFKDIQKPIRLILKEIKEENGLITTIYHRRSFKADQR